MSNTAQKIIETVREKFDDPEGFIPLHVPRLQGNEKAYLNKCIDSTFVSSVGEFVDQFEINLAKYTGAKRVVVCVNGTNAIHLALKAAGVDENDEVITQPLTFVATTNAINYAGAIPVFVDVDKDTMGLSPEALIQYLEKNTETKNGKCYHTTTGHYIKACLPMHTFGHACRIEEIAEICKEHHISLVEDAAEAMGSRLNGKHLGTFGELGVVSFNGNKIMTTGGGGAILCQTDALADKLKHWSTQAKIPHQWEYDHDAIGYNYRMPNLNAALGVAQLEQLDTFLDKKRKLALGYKKDFIQAGVEFFDERTDEKCNFWLNALILNDKNERDMILKATNENGIMTRPIWKLMNKLPMFAHCPQGKLTQAKWLEDRVINIPSSVIEK